MHNQQVMEYNLKILLQLFHQYKFLQDTDKHLPFQLDNNIQEYMDLQQHLGSPK